MEIVDRKKFSDCSRYYLEKQFDLQQLTQHFALQEWLENAKSCSVDEMDTIAINRFQEVAIPNFDTWNEIELIECFIAPLLAWINFNTATFKIFSEREIRATIDSVDLYGEPDVLISKGKWLPEQPYFCFNEYKKQEESKGDAAGQVLAAMLVAQELNNHKYPIYGIYVVGKYWNFVVLQNKEYSISKSYTADDEEIFDIYKILKALKDIIKNNV
jgi:hypothetical protein